MKNQRAHRRSAQGFTLVEVMVAAALTVLLAAVLLGVLSASLEQWRRVSGSLSVSNSAAALLDRLARDLEGAFVRGDGGVWLAADVQAEPPPGAWAEGAGKPVEGSLFIDPDGPAELQRFGAAGVWLRLITTEGSPGGTSAPAAVSWQMARMDSGSGPRYGLLRTVIPASSAHGASAVPGTFELGCDLASVPEYTTGPLRSWDSLWWLAGDVVDFGVRFNGRDAAGRTVPLFPLRDRAAYAAGPADPWPQEAEIVVRILTPEGARRIAALESGVEAPLPGEDLAACWWRLASGNSRVFARRVTIVGGGR